MLTIKVIYMGEQATFDEVLDAVEGWPAEQQAQFVEVVQRRLAESRRAQIVRDLEEGRRELRQGTVKAGTVDEIMREIES